MDLKEKSAFAVDVCRAAGQLALSYFRERDKLNIDQKGAQDWVSDADRNVELQLIRYQYTYMRDAEPYFLAFSYWLLANSEGGAHDSTWEWQALFRPGFVHPAITEFFYKTSR